MSRTFDARQAQTTLFDALVDASREYGAKKPILEDQERNPVTYQNLIRAAFALGRKLAVDFALGEGGHAHEDDDAPASEEDVVELMKSTFDARELDE